MRNDQRKPIFFNKICLSRPFPNDMLSSLKEEK